MFLAISLLAVWLMNTSVGSALQVYRYAPPPLIIVPVSEGSDRRGSDLRRGYFAVNRRVIRSNSTTYVFGTATWHPAPAKARRQSTMDTQGTQARLHERTSNHCKCRLSATQTNKCRNVLRV